MVKKIISRKRRITALVPYGGSRAVRRRFIRRKRRVVRGRAVTTHTSRGEYASNPFRVRSRKLPKRIYRRALWNYTRFMQHYKTVGAVADLVATPTGSVNQTVFMTPFFSQDNNAVFWKTAGGLQDPGFGIAPAWASAGTTADPLVVFLRGGRCWISITCSGADVDPIRARVQLIWAKQQQRSVTDGSDSTALGFPGTATGYLGTSGINPSTVGHTGTLRPISWAFQDAPDYSQYFYPPVLDKSILLQQNQSTEIFWKIKPTKIDTDNFRRGYGWYPWLVVYTSEQGDRDGAPENIFVVRGFNMSFSVQDTLT